MKKVAIITLTGNYNYGNRLQNYALQEAIKTCGCDVYTLWNKTYKGGFIRRLKEFVKKIINYLKDKKFQRRVKKFSKFTNKYIKKYNNVIYTRDNLEFLNNKFDKFVIGSDQIWNYNGRSEDFGVFEFARFTEKSKCISYAPSFGMNDIPYEKRKIYKDGLEHIEHLSVREEKGVNIIYELTGRSAELVIDPTMLIEKERWDNIAIKPKGMPKGKFLLTYFIGGLNEVLEDKLKEIAEKKVFTIINLNDKENHFYYINPNEFLYLIKNAEVILTDSFHACVFSIIFQKSFFVFDREDYGTMMNSRLDTLLKRYDLTNRKLKIEEAYEKINRCESIFYKGIEEKLKIDKEKSFKFLEKALK